jgi:DNA-binding transcriptional LysR family regulator
MSERYPRVRLVVEPFLFSARPLFPQLENREVDLVITRPTLPIPPDEDAVEVLFNDRIRLAAGKDGPWARRRRIDLAELVDEPWITVPADDVGGRVVLDAFRARGLAEPRVAVTTYSVHLRHSLAADGRFIAALPASVLRFNAGNLRELPIDLPEPGWPVAIATPKKRAINPIAARFIESARGALSFRTRNKSLPMFESVSVPGPLKPTSGTTATWEPFKRVTSQLQVVPGEIEIKKP